MGVVVGFGKGFVPIVVGMGVGGEVDNGFVQYLLSKEQAVALSECALDD